MIKERYLVPAYGPDVEALTIALQSLKILGAKLKSDVAIVVPALNHAHSTILNKVIPEHQLKKLIKGHSFTLGNSNVQLSIVSQKTLYKTNAKALLGVFASKKMIQKIEASISCRALIMLPWTGDADIKEWKEQWSPTILELNQQS